MKCGLERFPCPWWKSPVPRILLSRFCQGQYIPKAHKALGSKENVWPLKETRLCQESVILKEKKSPWSKNLCKFKNFPLFKWCKLSSGLSLAVHPSLYPWTKYKYFQKIHFYIYFQSDVTSPLCTAGKRAFFYYWRTSVQSERYFQRI